jgi:putative phosphoserine phosphatase/1-acylglycerol-3-phosphate O-acyltransferase
VERSAAFFDLDRTLLRKASGPVLQDVLAGAGLVSARQLPGRGLLYRSYDVFGETLPAMVLARAAAVALAGRRRAAVRAAAKDAADALEPLVAPWAPGLLDDHRRAGRLVVMATTTPLDLVEPLAERLGFDGVVATRYATAGAGDAERYTGSLDGPFVWATGKLSAVSRWAADHDVDLSASWAYSDSIYDLPLLCATGHPTAVNPDVRLALVAVVRRWPQVHLDVPPGVPEVLGLEPLDLVRAVARPELFPYARFRIEGVERLPGRGPVLVVANHRSYFDVVALGLTLMRAGRAPRALAKKEVFDAPFIGTLARACGQIMVDRDGGGDEAIRAAEDALRAGEAVVVLPQGTIPRGAAFFDPVLKGRTGAARLAAATGAPVVPIGIWGTEEVWPRSARLPRVTNLVHPPVVAVRVGPPVAGLGRVDPVSDTETIMAAIAALLPDPVRPSPAPTADDIARASPPGGGLAG